MGSEKKTVATFRRSKLGNFLEKSFNLDDDRASEEEVRDRIAQSVDFSGSKLWILIFAILIASVALNINSTAVLIGAMLISPLMGPILGIGLSLAINDFELLKRSFRNFLFSIAISVVASTLYFLISPLSTAQSELIARTTPTIYDVLIAIFGGMAGIIAQSRKDRTSMVIPGVAIATTLMPPLCTAGYGIATGQPEFIYGALYFFFINAVFISFSTFFLIRFQRYRKVKQLDEKREKRVRHYMIIIIVVTLVPSVILAYNMVQKAVFEKNAEDYVSKVFASDNYEILNKEIKFDPKSGNSIDLLLMGEPLSEQTIDMLRAQLPVYHLANTRFRVRQATSGDRLDNESMQNILVSNAEIITEKNLRIAQLERDLAAYVKDTIPETEMAREFATLWGGLQSFSVNRAVISDAQGVPTDTVLLCVVGTSGDKKLPETETEKITRWLKVRTGMEKIRLIVESPTSENPKSNDSE